MSMSSRHARALLVCAAFAPLLPAVARAAVINSQWVGDGDDQNLWSSPSSWSPNLVPDNNATNQFDVTITHDGSPYFFVGPRFDQDVTINNLTLVNRGFLTGIDTADVFNVTVLGTTSQVTTPGHDGELGVIQPKPNATWNLGTLANISPAGVLSGGYVIDRGSTLIARDADVRTNTGYLVIAGTGRLIDQNGRSAFRNLTTNGDDQGRGQLNIVDGTFTTPGDFTNRTFLDVEAASADADFVVTGNLTNYDPSDHSLNGGFFNIHSGSGPYAATLHIPGADIHTLNVYGLTLQGNAHIVDQSGNDALRNLQANAGNLTLGGHIDVTTTAPTFTNSGFLTIQGDGYVQVHTAFTSTGTIVLANPGSNATLAAQGAVFFDSTSYLNGTGTVYSDLNIISHATVSPGFSPGAVTFDAPTTTFGADSHLVMEIAGTDPADFDRIIAINSAHPLDGATLTLDGDLIVSLLGGFVPGPSDSFLLVTADHVAGMFPGLSDGSRIDTTGHEGSFLLTYSPTGVTLSNFVLAPEPASLSLLGLAALPAFRRSRRR